MDARLLVGHALGLDAVQLACNEHAGVLSSQVEHIETLAVRRMVGEPVARILGFKEFYGLEFALNEATLVPRPETEMLVDRGIQILRGQEKPTLLELGVGTGCIGISILVALTYVHLVGTDISAQALEMAKANAQTYGVNARIIWGKGSWFEAVSEHEKFDLIVSNPPYIVSRAMGGLQVDVRDFDPELALDGGKDGLTAYVQIISGAKAKLKPGGVLLLEIGFDQAESVFELCKDAGFDRVELRKDTNGLARMIEASNEA